MNKCNRCGYEWTSKKSNIKPKACPNCKRYDWHRELKQELKE